MSWQVVAPDVTAKAGTKVVTVMVPHFPDEIDYEGILGRAFSSPTDRDWMASGGAVILATPIGFDALKELMDGPVDVMEGTVKQRVMQLAMDRQIVALRWQP